MPIIDQVGSCVNLAKQMRRDLDMTALTTPVQTHTLKMLLDLVVELGEPQAPAMHEQRARTVAEMVSELRQQRGDN